MTDILAPAARSERMRRVCGKNTRPEMMVRGLAHRLGYRFRLHRRDLPGSPDLVFPARRAVIFVHGCFWHQHDCPRGARRPSSNASYWHPKLARNVERDGEVRQRLENEGWRVLAIWECEMRDSEQLSRRLTGFLDP
ncbi:DNA mismatch endonuclease Vsr [Sphingomonas sp. CD22]|uniref:very short patch repair endonuclease n=1 Tax=Sphingomonas sp. CD22 TaxID=3100214 RepID=UPI002ADF9C82|nr:DNA mismatch endonuclease Vsr [Sphingomonas sp. CD22]MEA1086425.1 DNA mismatch endonuclease Vsr [Sphingomonas sp. CD22]